MVEKKKHNYDFSKLKGRIREKLGTQKEYSERIGISEGYLYKIFANDSKFDQDDIENSIAPDVLDIERKEIPDYFLTLLDEEKTE